MALNLKPDVELKTFLSGVFIHIFVETKNFINQKREFTRQIQFITLYNQIKNF